MKIPRLARLSCLAPHQPTNPTIRLDGAAGLLSGDDRRTKCGPLPVDVSCSLDCSPVRPAPARQHHSVMCIDRYCILSSSDQFITATEPLQRKNDVRSTSTRLITFIITITVTIVQVLLLILFYFSHTSTLQPLDKPWSQVSSLVPPGSCLQFLSRIGSAIPLLTARRFFIGVLLITHALAFSASQFVHKKKSPTNLSEYALGGLELTNLTYTRLEDNLICHRGYRLR